MFIYEWRHLSPTICVIFCRMKFDKLSILKNYRENKINKIKLFFKFLILISFFIHSEAKAQSKTWVAPNEANSVKNPLAGNTEILKYAKVIYTTYCTPCHGTGGKGDGIAAASLPKKPANHTSDYVQKQSDGALYWMVTTGNSPMPSYKTVLTNNQRWELINYIRTLAKNK